MKSKVAALPITIEPSTNDGKHETREIDVILGAELREDVVLNVEPKGGKSFRKIELSDD